MRRLDSFQLLLAAQDTAKTERTGLEQHHTLLRVGQLGQEALT